MKCLSGAVDEGCFRADGVVFFGGEVRALFGDTDRLDFVSGLVGF